MSQRMIAKFAGRCDCGQKFAKGEPVLWDRARRRIAGCPRCMARAEADLARRFDMDYEDQCASACGPGL